jgi:hypothetical protein
MASRALLLAVSNALKLTYLVLKAACNSSGDSLVSVPAQKVVFIQSMIPVVIEVNKKYEAKSTRAVFCPC